MPSWIQSATIACRSLAALLFGFRLLHTSFAEFCLQSLFSLAVADANGGGGVHASAGDDLVQDAAAAIPTCSQRSETSAHGHFEPFFLYEWNKTVMNAPISCTRSLINLHCALGGL